jgi:carboxyl-terminal processing protease
VVQVRGSDGKVEVLADDTAGETWSGPLVVLTSPLSASASEIVAGALQDYGRAIVVGAETTHGKGSVQQVLDLAPFLERVYGQEATERSESLKITTQQFYRVTGSSTQSKGVRSDVVLPSPWQGLPVYETDMPHALPWSQIAPAKFTAAGSLAASIPALQQHSAARVAASADFAKLQQRLAEREKARADNVISLNLDKRRAELQASGVEDLPDAEDDDAPKAEKAARDLAADFVLQEAAAVLREEIGTTK